MLANCHRDPRKRSRPFTAADFHPETQRGAAGMRVTRDTIEAVVAMFVTPEEQQRQRAWQEAKARRAEALAARQRERRRGRAA